MSNGNGSSSSSALTPEWMRVSKSAPAYAPARGPAHISELNYADAQTAMEQAPEVHSFAGNFEWDMPTMEQLLAVHQPAFVGAEQRPQNKPQVASTFKDHLNLVKAPLTGGDIRLDDMLTGPKDHLSMLAKGAKPQEKAQPQDNRTPALEKLRHRISLGNFKRNQSEQIHEKSVAAQVDTQEAEAQFGQPTVQAEFNPFRRTTAKEGRRIASSPWGQAEIRKARKRGEDRQKATQKQLSEPSTKPRRGLLNHTAARNSHSEIGKNTSSGGGQY
jgi:hypothetical protein